MVLEEIKQCLHGTTACAASNYQTVFCLQPPGHSRSEKIHRMREIDRVEDFSVSYWCTKVRLVSKCD